MNIGNIQLKNPFLAAPLAGVTDAPARSLASMMGAALTFSEMVSGKGLMYNNRNTEDLLYIRPEEDNVAYQIFGCEPDVMEWTAKALAGRDNCILDINMGCPVPKIVKNGEGSALMKDPVLAGRIVSAVCRGASAGAEEQRKIKPVTVKMRAGWDDDSRNAAEVALACEEGGASAVTIHGRTRMQYYSGKADWDIIRQVKSEIGIPVIGNGDIFTAEDAVRMLDETGCDAVMIARGAMGNPWIFREANALWEGRPVPPRPELDEIYDIMRRHFIMLMEDKGEKRSVFEMRKHVGWYMKGQPHAAELRRRINTITSAQEMEKALSVHI
ncbi:MAG: tRNA dihydrouridine synthase DusB [Anaerovoracaceae bacterium]|jgi:tRNA-dihydrouridine synthase B|nr:tRNA dihydrouridine synthase DusB [Anaerovoracaceae bacterium]